MHEGNEKVEKWKLRNNIDIIQDFEMVYEYK